MGKGYLKARRAAGSAHHGPCFKEGCKINGSTIHTCITCEKLAGEAVMKSGETTIGKVVSVFSVQCCRVHYDEGLKKVKRHALTAHPVNLLRVMAAGLKGEDIG